MSYDLYFKRRAGEFTAEDFAEYFGKRAHYDLQGSQAWYQNEDTGVYFVFELGIDSDDPELESFAVSLNVNYFRPSFFGLEAEPEVTAFARAFDMVVSDPQTNGMGEGEYRADFFLSGWNTGNEFGYRAILREPAARQEQATLPSETLIKAWVWNRARNELQNQLGEAKFVPRIMFMLIAGKAATIAVWPDGIPIAVPDVDYFMVPRKELAPRRFLRRVQDETLVSSKDVLPIFNKHGTARPNGTLVLNYVDAPREIREFVASLPLDKREIAGVPNDKILDRELVEKCV